MTTPERSLVYPIRSQPDQSMNNSSPVFRVEVRRAARVAYAERPVFGCQFTLSSQWPIKTEFLLQPEQTLGWLDHNRLDHLRLKPHYPTTETESQATVLTSMFCAHDGSLRSLFPLTVYLLSDNMDTLKTQGAFLFSRPL